SKAIENVFLHPEKAIGTDKNFEKITSGIKTWEHFHVVLPDAMYVSKNAAGTIGSRFSDYTAMHDVLLRSLTEISTEAIETVQDLIAQNSLYRGSEKKAVIDA